MLHKCKANQSFRQSGGEATIGEEKDQQLVVVGDFREVPTKPATALCLTEGEAPYKDVSY